MLKNLSIIEVCFIKNVSFVIDNFVLMSCHIHCFIKMRVERSKYRVSRFYRFLWFASERYLIFRFSKDWCLIFFLNMGDLLFEQKIWLKVNFMVLYGIPKSNQGFWEFFNNLPEYHSFKPDCLALRCEKKTFKDSIENL